MMFALRQMMTLSLIMFPSEMMCGFATFGKHRIIANEMSNIIFAKQMHHIAAGDASSVITYLFRSFRYTSDSSFFGLPAFSFTEGLPSAMSTIAFLPFWILPERISSEIISSISV